VPAVVGARLVVVCPKNPNWKIQRRYSSTFLEWRRCKRAAERFLAIDFPRKLTEKEARVVPRALRVPEIGAGINRTTLKTCERSKKLGVKQGINTLESSGWEPYWPRPDMRSRIAKLSRYIVTPETPTYTLFAWLPSGVVPDKNLIVFARDDETFFGILHSRAHLLWVRALGSPYGNHPTARRYNNSRVFETFPFPEGLTPNMSAKGLRERSTRASNCEGRDAAR